MSDATTTNFNETHPECQPGEKWLMNARIENVESFSLRTARVGMTAYGSDGIPLLAKGEGFRSFAPIFVSDEEYEQRKIHTASATA